MITLIVGGTRSGKSALAERLAAATAAPVTYLATAVVDPGDGDHMARVAAHRSRRPPTWTTVVCGASLAPALEAVPDGTIVVDSLGSWVAAHRDWTPDLERVVDALVARRGHTFVVAEEVGMAVHAATDSARRFVDRLGEASQAIGAVADEVLLVVAGRVVALGTR